MLEEMQEEAQETIAEIRRNQELEKGIISELLEAFPGLQFDTTEMAVKVAERGEGDVQFWGEVAMDQEDKETSM